MVVLTYTFVNSLEPAADASGTTGGDPPFPHRRHQLDHQPAPEIASFMVTLDIFENQAIAFRDEVVGINTDWDSRSITFAEART